MKINGKGVFNMINGLKRVHTLTLQNAGNRTTLKIQRKEWGFSNKQS